MAATSLLFIFSTVHEMLERRRLRLTLWAEVSPPDHGCRATVTRPQQRAGKEGTDAQCPLPGGNGSGLLITCPRSTCANGGAPTGSARPRLRFTWVPPRANRSQVPNQSKSQEASQRASHPSRSQHGLQIRYEHTKSLGISAANHSTRSGSASRPVTTTPPADRNSK